ncbi:hypothetical protein [Cohnella cholangitidis]|uniref:Uncharacterized protein n=1 Tax=Cohnella cholangitidis TaxID=2598458 RepID=A0A7G5BSW4_9BACL|nr:hypothetical protein [Cohnella cholangitidis]QMV40048.1 hypothetical protein FPL14_01655 [Cohnella cholangitidis]
MNMHFMSNLPPIGESVAKLASEGGQLISDMISVYGFFAFCLLLVGCCLMVPVHMYEKYYKVADDESPVELNHDHREATGPAA